MEIMSEAYTPAPRALLACAACGATLRRVTECDAEHFLCPRCGRCWTRTAHGALRGVDVVTCDGCLEQAREVCVELLGATFPRFGVLAD